MFSPFSAIPFYARMAELFFKIVENSLIEAVRSIGNSRLQIVRHVLISETLPNLITGFTVMVISLNRGHFTCWISRWRRLGGHGDLICYGYQGYNTSIMTIVIILLIILNVIIQRSSDKIVEKLDKILKHLKI
ncbi:ABC transporter permease subunit [Bartonella quintana]|uniref:ABC transporter permease subunit n=1 Tax=Bartonella quintana TaxID=803 RepID=UPI00030D0B6B|nr:ABC transporter permease subunit [Bartonella quintana]